MALFQRAINTQAYLKAGIMGFAGDGKPTQQANWLLVW
ncbi:Uncharacterised protein [Escherichia coli]|nr:hypothetical protein SS53G_1546 [Shigella sonnei 53G]STO69790.1 Uncharacterised protein [Escherichia coli]